MTEQEKKDCITLVTRPYCDGCPFQYDQKCKYNTEKWEDYSELYCHKMANKLDIEIVPFG